jgi:hypothetical protein
MARAARAHGDGTTPADVVVDLVADPRDDMIGAARARVTALIANGPDAA